MNSQIKNKQYNYAIKASKSDLFQSHSKENDISHNQAGITQIQNKSKFIKTIEDIQRTNTTMKPGWNGKPAFDRERLTDSYNGIEKIQAALVDVFTGCTRGGGLAVRSSFIKALEEFEKIPRDNKETRSEYLAYIVSLLAVIRSPREGMGERDIYYICLTELFKFDRRVGQFVLFESIRSFGSFLDLNALWQICLIPENTDKEHFLFIRECIAFLYIESINDNERKYNFWEHMSKQKKTSPPKYNLGPKWIPKAGSSYKKGSSFPDHDLNLIIALRKFPRGPLDSWNHVSKLLRVLVSKQNKLLKTVEINMCGKNFEGIPYSTAPSGARKKYGKYSWRNKNKDGSQRSVEIDRVNGALLNQECIKRALQTGKGIKASDSGIVGIVSELFGSSCNADDIDRLQASWNVCVREMKDRINDEPNPNSLSLGKMVVVCDTSHSMYSGISIVPPLHVAIAMSLFVCEFTTAPWNSGVISFSEYPTWHSLPEGNSTKDKLWERYKRLIQSPWGYSTDFSKVLDLVLNVIESEDLKQEDCPESILVVSDMQVNKANMVNGGNSKTLIEEAQDRFVKKGLVPPVIILWNVNASSTTPATPHQKGVICISGYSEKMLMMVLDGSILSHIPPTPWETTKIVLTKPWTSNLQIGAEAMIRYPQETSTLLTHGTYKVIPNTTCPNPFYEFWGLDDVRWKTSDPEELIALEKKLALERQLVSEKNVASEEKVSPKKEMDPEEKYKRLLKEKLVKEGFDTTVTNSKITDSFIDFMKMHFI